MPLSPRHLALGLAATLGLAPMASQAASLVEQVSIACSGTLVSSDTHGYSLQCTGDLDLNGQSDTARIWSDGAIELSATGQLVLNHLKIEATGYTFTAGTSLLLASDVHLPTPYPVTSGVTIRADEDPTLRAVDLARLRADGTVPLQGGTVTLQAGVVPEPATWALSLAGLAGWALVRRRGA